MEKMPKMIPMLVSRDVAAAVEWFKKLGFELVFSMDGPAGKPVHAHVVMGEAHFMIGDPMELPYERPNRSVYFYINVSEKPDIDAFCQEVKDKGVMIEEEPMDKFWGDRTFVVHSPEGFHVTFAKNVKQLTPEQIKEAMLAGQKK